MSYTTVRTEIETLFLADFPIAEPSVRVAMENDNFKADNTDWVRLTVQHATTDFLSLNSLRERFIGLIQIQIFTKIGEGTANNDRIADSIADIFRGRSVNGINYRNSTKLPAQIIDGWLQSRVVTEYWHDA